MIGSIYPDQDSPLISRWETKWHYVKTSTSLGSESVHVRETTIEIISIFTMLVALLSPLLTRSEAAVLSSPSWLYCPLGLFWSVCRCGTDNLLKTGSFLFRPIQCVHVWWHKTANPTRPTAAVRWLVYTTIRVHTRSRLLRAALHVPTAMVHYIGTRSPRGRKIRLASKPL